MYWVFSRLLVLYRAVNEIRDRELKVKEFQLVGLESELFNLKMALLQHGTRLYKLTMNLFKFQLEHFQLKGNFHWKFDILNSEMQRMRTFRSKNGTWSIQNKTFWSQENVFKYNQIFSSEHRSYWTVELWT